MKPKAIVRLADIASVNPRLTLRPDPDESVSFVPMAAVDAVSGAVADQDVRNFGEVQRGYTVFEDGDLLLAKITPCFENGKIAQARLRHRVGAGSTEFHVIRPDQSRVEGRYLLHLLRQPRIRLLGARRMTGSAGQRRVPDAFVSSIDVPLPSLHEQRRIVEVLDRVDGLRAKRRESLARLEALTASIFNDLFGDIKSNPNGFPMHPFGSMLTIPLRNGVSPSSDGGHEAEVLTLSSITGTGFNPSARKVGKFRGKPSPMHLVAPSDFLICRGNGNRDLVGRGAFAVYALKDVVFPDTIIAARVDSNVLTRAYLECLWNSRLVRGWIESTARTTNGIFKINQQMIEGLSLPVPGLELQQEFDRRVERVLRMKDSYRASLAELDELFASVQDRAFRGEL